MSIPRVTEILESGTDATTEAAISVSFPEYKIHIGEHYFFDGHTTLGVDGAIYFKIVIPDTIEWAHFLWDFHSTGIITAVFVEDATGGMTGGTAVPIINNNRNSANTSGLTITKEVSAYTGGTVISELKFGSKTGGGHFQEKPIILKQNTVYCGALISDSAANIIGFLVEWYEHANE